ncbi:MAG: hypothetical protein ABGX78_00035 [Microbacterium sp.]
MSLKVEAERAPILERGDFALDVSSERRVFRGELADEVVQM